MFFIFSHISSWLDDGWRDAYNAGNRETQKRNGLCSVAWPCVNDSHVIIEYYVYHISSDFTLSHG